MLSTTNCVALPVGRLTSYKNHLHVDMRLKLKTCPEDCSPPKHAGADLLQCRGNSWTVHHLLCLASSMQLHLARVALLTLGSLQGASAPRPPVAPAPALQWKAAYPQSHGATPAQRQWCVQAHLLQQRVLACQLLPPRLLLLTLDCCLHSACHWQKPCGPLARSHHVLMRWGASHATSSPCSAL